MIDIITLISTVVSGCHRHVNTVNTFFSAAPLKPEGGIYPSADLQRDQSAVSETESHCLAQGHFSKVHFNCEGAPNPSVILPTFKTSVIRAQFGAHSPDSADFGSAQCSSGQWEFAEADYAS